MPLTPQETRVAQRQELLEQIFTGLLAGLDLGFANLELNRVVLFNVVVSYFHDVDRHKDFHGSERVDEAKQAAFTIKWISKLRPIQFTCEVEDASQSILFINEMFAVRCGLAFMKLSPAILPRQLYDDLLYALRYRPVDERMLFVWLATLQLSVDGQISSQ
ncbi:MAG: hypothetical protein OXK76_19445 [Gammaproteobacteria bacterium]|nr:hypothetical protein [Gammaproteobacteria bacterium]